MKKYKYKILYILLFSILIFYPVISKGLGIVDNLNGVTNEVKLKDLNFNNLLDLSFQNSLDTYITDKLPGKSILVKLRSQILFSIFKVASHISLNISKNGAIMSDEPMNYYYHGLHSVEDEYIDNFVKKLNQLDEILKNKHADLVLFITPTKARYINENDYFVDKMISNNTSFDEKNYELPYYKLKNALNSTNIKTFDCIDYIEKNNRKFFEDVPLYCDSGHHWSVAVGNKIGMDFLDFVSNNTNVKFSKLSQTIEETKDPVFPDSDILDLCNLLRKPNYKYYKSNLSIVDPYHTKSNIIIRGGSFLGQVPFVQSMYEEDSNVIYMSNTDTFVDNWKTYLTISDYNDIDLKKYTKDIDLIVLEINEVNIYNATFGFLDYLIDNKDILFR